MGRGNMEGEIRERRRNQREERRFFGSSEGVGSWVQTIYLRGLLLVLRLLLILRLLLVLRLG